MANTFVVRVVVSYHGVVGLTALVPLCPFGVVMDGAAVAEEKRGEARI